MEFNITANNLNIERSSKQKVQSLIRQQSGLGLHYLPCNQQFLGHCWTINQTVLILRKITVVCQGVLICSKILARQCVNEFRNTIY